MRMSAYFGFEIQNPSIAQCSLVSIENLKCISSLQLTLVTLQAKLGYVLIGILGEKCLKQYGYPHACVIRILHHVLDLAGVKV